MFEGVRNFYATRPILAWTLTILGGLILLWLVARAAAPSSAVSTGYTVAPADPNLIAASTALEQAQIDADTQIALANIRATSDAQALETQALARGAELAVQAELTRLGFASDERIAQLSANLETLGIASAERVSLANIAAQTHSLDVQATVNAAQIQATRDIELAQQAAGVSLQQSLLNAQVAVEQSRNQAQVAIATVQGQTQQQVVNRQADVAEQEAVWGNLSGIIHPFGGGGGGNAGSVLGGVASIIGLFSDSRLKCDVTPLYRDAHGLQWYKFRYSAKAQRLDKRIDGRERIGLLADELQYTRFASAVGRHRGYLTLDYNQIPGGSVACH